jgi:thioester reductase-like protein
MVEINKKKFSTLVVSPKKISLDETLAIRKIIEQYPYFQTARIIELVGLKIHNSIRFNNSLKDCSIFTTNREILREIIELQNISSTHSITEKKNYFIEDSEKSKNSFIDWLKKTKPISKLDSENQLIDNFLKSKPEIKNNNSNINLAKEFKLNKKEYMTETLAKLYIKQEKFKDAVKAYEILSLKYPEKISLFADQIKSIKNSLKKHK